MLAGIKNEHLPKVQRLLKTASKNMSFIEDDGVGYAAITKDGKVYGEKWRNKEDAFEIHSQPASDPIISFINTMFGDAAKWDKAPVTSKVYDSFGSRTIEAIDNTVAVILHARKATQNSAKVIENVHPFCMIDQTEQPDTALIHNGNILNHAKLTKTMSTCDSEVILHEYLANMMYHNPWGIEQLAKTLIGEYAVGVLSSMSDTDGAITPYLDVFKSGNKDLYAGWVPELETMVFCTTEHVLTNSCKESDLTVKNIIKIQDGFLMRIDAVTGIRTTDLVSFTESARFENVHTQNHRHSMVPAAVVGPANQVTDDITETSDDTIESAKKHFERRHPSLFTQPYVEVNKKLEDHEEALLCELDKNPNTNHRALHLVNVALAAAKA